MPAVELVEVAPQVPATSSIASGPQVLVSSPAPPPSSIKRLAIWGLKAVSDALETAGASDSILNMMDAACGVDHVPAAARLTSSVPTCPICIDLPATFILAECGHALCVDCAVTYLRESLGNARTAISACGLRCPLHSAGCDGCIGTADVRQLITPRNASRLAAFEATGEVLPGIGGPPEATAASPQLTAQLITWGERHVLPFLRLLRPALRSMAPPEPLSASSLTLDEVKRFDRYVIEAAVPESQRIWCPRCRLLLLRTDPADIALKVTATRRLLGSRRLRAFVRAFAARLRGRPPSSLPPAHDATCPHCHFSWDPRGATGDRSYDEMVSECLIRLTSKACPNPGCGQPISHFHGHACHHISPLTNGCPACHQHFCYVCRRRHGTPGGGYARHRRCPHGSSFCSSDNLSHFIVLEPYPHDRRCGCPFCPHCKGGQPCPQCDGSCAVCRGLVPPAPTELTAATLQLATRLQARRGHWATCSGCCPPSLRSYY